MRVHLESWAYFRVSLFFSSPASSSSPFCHSLTMMMFCSLISSPSPSPHHHHRVYDESHISDSLVVLNPHCKERLFPQVVSAFSDHHHHQQQHKKEEEEEDEEEPSRRYVQKQLISMTQTQNRWLHGSHYKKRMRHLA